ncbi:gamma-glutamylcyclotransferase [Cognatishimia sp. SS12]|nr:gamma-glutamylcyclotransferase [Cognatishimia sp. SS12]
MQSDRFFGYGSLVNRRTHNYRDFSAITLSGWQRVWRQTATFQRPILTIEPALGVEIDGARAAVPGGDWRALDAREHAYDRVLLEGGTPHGGLATYVIGAQKYAAPDALHPIFLSYLDVVLQGFFNEYGRDGLRRFCDTTRGWEAGIRDDRRAPQYPRHQRLTPQERALVDQEIARLGCKVLP